MQGKHWPPANYCAGKHIIHFCPLGWSPMSINTDHAVHGLHLNLEQTHKITSKLLSNRSKWKHMNSPRHCLSSKILIWSNKRHSVVLDDQWTAKKEWRIIPLNEFLNGPEFGLWPEVLKMYQHKCCMSSYIPDLFVLFLAWERTPQSFTFSRELIALSLFVVFWLLNFHSNGCHKGSWVPVSHTSHSKIDL